VYYTIYRYSLHILYIEWQTNLFLYEPKVVRWRSREWPNTRAIWVTASLRLFLMALIKVKGTLQKTFYHKELLHTCKQCSVFRIIEKTWYYIVCNALNATRYDITTNSVRFPGLEFHTCTTSSEFPRFLQEVTQCNATLREFCQDMSSRFGVQRSTWACSWFLGVEISMFSS